MTLPFKIRDISNLTLVQFRMACSPGHISGARLFRGWNSLEKVWGERRLRRTRGLDKTGQQVYEPAGGVEP